MSSDCSLLECLVKQGTHMVLNSSLLTDDNVILWLTELPVLWTSYMVGCMIA